jgi:hypothetical protein
MTVGFQRSVFLVEFVSETPSTVSINGKEAGLHCSLTTGTYKQILLLISLATVLSAVTVMK